MYVIQCTKSGVCDFYFNGGCTLGVYFRKNEFITSDGLPTRSINRAITFTSKVAAKEFMHDVNSDLNEDEAIPEFASMAVTLSLK